MQEMPLTKQVPQFTAGSLKVKTYKTRSEMGAAAASDVADKVRELLSQKNGNVNIIFAAAPSQTELLLSLSKHKDIDWSRVNGFHMDEYIGIERNAPQSFGYFLQQHIFDKLPFNEIFYINGTADDEEAECRRYAGLLQEHPVDIVCMGIGENTHIAFNDPHTADFNDPLMVKVVTLDEASRQQQVHDGCFPELSTVPRLAITLTVPALLMASSIFCIVPGIKKAEAVFLTIRKEISERYPSTSLKNHDNATLYLDSDSAGQL